MTIAHDFVAQKLIDEEIATEIKRHEERIKALRIRRNTYSAINQLPSDVLSEILLAAKVHVETRSSSLGAFTSRAYSRWTVLLRVCRSWHDHIMNSPRFWCTINTNSPHASGMLARSKAVPLRVQVNTPLIARKQFWSLFGGIISHSSRLQEVSIHLPDYDVLSRALELIPPASSAPYLSRLTIQVEEDVGNLSGSFWENLPVLQSLSLHGGPLPSTAHSMPNLTHLKISLSSEGVAVDWLLRTLERLPNLQDLDISELCAPLLNSDLPSVSLPHLQAFHVDSVDPSTLTILDYLITPPSSRIEIFYNGVEIADLKVADLSALKKAISRRMSSKPSIQVDISFEKHFQMSVYIQDDVYDPPDFGAPSVFCVFPMLPEADVHILLQLFELVPLHQAPILSLSGLTTRNVSSVCPSFIPSSSSFKTLILDSCPGKALQLLVLPRNGSHPPSPELECIHFQNTWFHKKKGPNNIYITLGNILRERKRRMVPIPKVILEECKIESWAMKGLEQLVEVEVL